MTQQRNRWKVIFYSFYWQKRNKNSFFGANIICIQYLFDFVNNICLFIFTRQTLHTNLRKYFKFVSLLHTLVQNQYYYTIILEYILNILKVRVRDQEQLKITILKIKLLYLDKIYRTIVKFYGVQQNNNN